MLSIRRAVVIVLSACLILSACTKSDEPAIRFGLANMPANMDPRHYTDAASTRVGRLIYQRLVEFNDEMRPVPGIAYWKKNSNTEYVFHLIGTPVFHNGNKLTSADVKATYDYVLDKKNGSPHRASLALIKSIETPDAKTIVFHLSRQDPLFPAYLVLGIVPASLAQQNHRFERQPVGSGPFRFVEWPEDGKLIIERLKDRQRVEFIHTPNPTVRVLKLMHGEIDMLQNDVPPELIAYLEKQDDVVVRRRKGSNYAYMGFNMQDPILADLRIRKAIAHGINKQEIIKYVFAGSARSANALLPPTHWAGNKQLKEYTYDPQKSRDLLKKAGFGNQTIELTYKTSNDPFRVRLATIIQSQLKDIGINVDIRSYDWGTFYGDIKSGRFQLYSLAWVGIKTPDIFRYVFHSNNVPPNGANRGRFSNPEVDQLIEAAEELPALDAQAEKYRQLQALIHELLPYVPLWYEDHVVVARKQIKNYEIPADGNYDGLVYADKR